MVSDSNFKPTDGTQLVSSGDDGIVRLWDTYGHSLGELPGHLGRVWSVAFNPDGKRIVSSGDDGIVRLWDISGQPEKKWQGNQSQLLSVAFSPNGHQIVSGGGNGMIYLWDASGQLVHDWTSTQGPVNSVAFSRDRIITGDKGGTVHLWNTSGQLLHSFQGGQDEIRSVVFSSDGKQIVSVGDDETMRFWYGGSWKDLLKVACNRLREHPLLTKPKTEAARGAGETCQKYAWNKTEISQFLVSDLQQ